jgi:hypothetical protein
VATAISVDGSSSAFKALSRLSGLRPMPLSYGSCKAALGFIDVLLCGLDAARQRPALSSRSMNLRLPA